MKSATADVGIHPKRILAAMIAGAVVVLFILYRYGPIAAWERSELVLLSLIGLGAAWLVLLLMNLAYFAPRSLYEKPREEKKAVDERLESLLAEFPRIILALNYDLELRGTSEKPRLKNLGTRGAMEIRTLAKLGIKKS